MADLSYLDASQAVQIVNENNSSIANVDTSGRVSVIDFAKLVPKEYDYIALTYVTTGNGIGEIETAVYKTGGSSGTTVATLTLAYDSSNRLSSITR